MRVLVDQETGELVEVIEELMISDLTPYDYRQAKAAAMRASTQRRKAVEEYRGAIRHLAGCEKNYRRELAMEVARQKAIGPSTTAEVLAKGEPAVLKAREAYVLADGMRYAALEVIRGCDGDRPGEIPGSH